MVQAHMTRYQTEMASEQSRSVMIFTVFTIIFLPLSFFAVSFSHAIQIRFKDANDVPEYFW